MTRASRHGTARPNFVRGRVISYDELRVSWKLKYTDNYVENVGIDALNQALQRRYDHDHGEAGLGSTPAFQRSSSTRSRYSTELDALRKELLDGVDPVEIGRWTLLAYDIWHFLKNWLMMLAVDKHSYIARVFEVMSADAIFEQVNGEYERLLRHLKHPSIGMDNDSIKELDRAYLRRMMRYVIPAPIVIIWCLFDVYAFVVGMEDPERPGQMVLVPNAREILIEEMAYVQRGLLRDQSDMPYKSSI